MAGWFRSVLYVVLDATAPSDGLSDAIRVADWFDASLSVQTVTPQIPRRHRRLGLDPQLLSRSTERSLRSWVGEQLKPMPQASRIAR